MTNILSNHLTMVSNVMRNMKDLGLTIFPLLITIIFLILVKIWTVVRRFSTDIAQFELRIPKSILVLSVNFIAYIKTVLMKLPALETNTSLVEEK